MGQMDEVRERMLAYMAKFAVLNEVKRREAQSRTLEERVRMMDDAYAFGVSQGWTGEKPFDFEHNRRWLTLKRKHVERSDAGI